jgi:hypothetical protein
MDKLKCKHPSILTCEGIYVRDQKIDEVKIPKIMMIFPVAEKSLFDLYSDKDTKMTDEEILNMIE